MKKNLLLTISSLVLTCGCAHMSSSQLRVEKDGSTTTSHQTVTTLFDGKSEISKLRASTTDKTQGLTVSGLSEETSATNVVSLVDSVVSSAVTSAIKATVKP